MEKRVWSFFREVYGRGGGFFYKENKRVKVERGSGGCGCWDVGCEWLGFGRVVSLEEF